MTITIKGKSKGTVLEVQGWCYVKQRDNRVSAPEPLREQSAFQGNENSMCAGTPGFPITIIWGRVVNMCCVGFG